MRKLWTLALAAFCALAGSAVGQHATVGVPFQTNSNNYFEQIGVNFNFHSNNFFFQQNSFGLASPQFGGATPNAGATTGFALPLLGGQAYFNINASQGSRSSNVSQTPSTTLTNGVQGGFFDTTQTPFVTSLAPPNDLSPALERWQQLQAGPPPERPSPAPSRAAAPHKQAAAADAAESKPQSFATRLATAQPGAGGSNTGGSNTGGSNTGGSNTGGSGTLSVAELREMRAQQAQVAQHAVERETVALIERGREAEQGGKLSVARLYYEQAARRSTGVQRDELLGHVHALAETTAAKKTARRPSASQE